MSNLPVHPQFDKIYNPLGALPAHPHFEPRHNALGDLSNPSEWPRRVNVHEGSFVRTNPEPIFHCRAQTLSIDDTGGGRFGL